MEQSSPIKYNNDFEKDYLKQMNESLDVEFYFNKKELIDDGYSVNDEFLSIKNNQNVNEPKSLSIHSLEENKEVKLNINNKEKEKGKNIEAKRKFLVYNFFTPKICDEKEEEKKINKNNEKNTDKKDKFLICRKRRKEMSDNILKKIKSHFFKFIRKILKERIKKYNNKNCNFKFNQKNFITNISVKENKSIWEEKFYDFIEKMNEKDNNDEYEILNIYEKPASENMILLYSGIDKIGNELYWSDLLGFIA